MLEAVKEKEKFIQSNVKLVKQVQELEKVN